MRLMPYMRSAMEYQYGTLTITPEIIGCGTVSVALGSSPVFSHRILAARWNCTTEGSAFVTDCCGGCCNVLSMVNPFCRTAFQNHLSRAGDRAPTPGSL